MDFESVNTAFITWLKENGASISPAIALKDYSADGAGRGVIALDNIATSELAQKIDLSSLQGWGPLILCMIYEFYRGPESKWKSYFDILPTKFSTPMFWTEQDLQELDGTGVPDKIGQEEAESLFKESLWPIIREHPDHYPARLFHEKDCLRMVAIKKIDSGSQIFNTYGDLCNADLLRKYGFVDVPNPFDIAELSGEAIVAKCTASEDSGKDEKVEWLLENDGLEDVFILESQDDIPEEIIGCCRILLMPLEEFRSTIVTGKKSPSTKMTVEVQKVLRELLEEKDDRKLLKEADGPLSLSMKNAIIVRSGERAIIQSLLDKVKKWRPPTPAPAIPAGKQKPQAKGQHPNKGKKPYQKK
ncbi:hypothetical protein BGW38_004892 [Lunasporangiospora selenospora]|uniref:SET domain-containing protein n=1 Tax=Lunasporangiospora selenospora TaxID=979761 RepID=A0A9P6FPH1_9FUNG|nr:hypothetical protein BGW38_004892 [Lunasporangiospora selenospora]